jgi:hypothetical protein
MKKLVLFVSAWFGSAWFVFSLLGSGIVSAQVQPQAQALIDKAIAAHGGRTVIEGLKTMTYLEVGWYVSEGKRFTTGYREISDLPGRRARYEWMSDGAVVAAGQETEAGAVGWSQAEGLKTLKRNALFDSMDTEIFRRLLLPMVSAKVLGTRTVFGMTGVALTFKLPDKLDSYVYLLADDGTILAMSLDNDFFSAGYTYLLGDYRDVAGMRMFFSFRVAHFDELIEEYHALEVQVNQPLSDTVFAWPPATVLPTGRIGISTEPMPQGIQVTTVIPDAPAAKAGVLEGDLILEIDGLSMSGWNDLRPSGLRGEPGTVVVLTIKRGDQVLKFRVTRGAI